MMITAERITGKVRSKKLPSLAEEVFGQKGYSTQLQLSSDELDCLRKLMRAAWLNRIGQVIPDQIDLFKSICPSSYHEYEDQVPHDVLWTHEHRVFSREAASAISAFSIFQTLLKAFPGAEKTGRNPPHPDLGRPRFIWRIVRPGIGRDVGPCHADYWFDAVQDVSTNYPKNKIPVKFWIPLWQDAGTTGLSVVEGSHGEAWEFGREIRDGVVKPTFEIEKHGVTEVLLEVEPGSLIAFSDRLLHRGVNGGPATRTRISVEFVLLVPRNSIEVVCDRPIGLDIWTPLPA